MSRVILLVGTPKGAFILESDADRRSWTTRGPLCEGWPIHDLIVEPGSGVILAAGGSPWYGPAVWRSEDLGETWTHSSAGLVFSEEGDDAPAVATIWSLATTPDGALLAVGGYRSVLVWNVAEQTVVHRLAAPLSGRVTALVFVPESAAAPQGEDAKASTAAAVPPPAMRASDHCMRGDMSVTTDAMAIVPATAAAGVAMLSSALSTHGM